MTAKDSSLKVGKWPKLKSPRLPLVVDLFSGVGGFSFGFEQSGFRTVLGVDFDDPALQTFRHNHPHADALNLDLAEKGAVDRLKSALKGKAVDVLLAGPPCQGFSLTGPRNLEDPRNQLYMSALETARALKPTAFIIENVPGMKTLYGGQVLSDVLERIRGMGYSTASGVLTAADFGVPQMRRRLIILAVKGTNLPVTLPEPMLKPRDYVSCAEAIGDLPSREGDLGSEVDDYELGAKTGYQRQMRTDSTHLCNHVATRHTELVRSVIRLVPEGGNYRDLPDGVGTSRRFNEAWTRYHSAKPSRTIDTGHRNHFHYKWDRVPTIRENARLQSFPDRFVFLGTKTQQNRQVGNAVPPLLAQAPAHHIRKLLSR